MEPVISFDKFIDVIIVMGLDENDHICIFMNIIKMSNIKEKRRKKNYSHCKVLVVL